jgi:hypothetical protein
VEQRKFTDMASVWYPPRARRYQQNILSGVIMIKPSIGRKLWFWESRAAFDAARANNFDHELLNVAEQPLDATVVAVWNPTMINVYVIDHSGIGRAETSVQLIQEGDVIPPGRFATWMPFQVGQARAQAAA